MDMTDQGYLFVSYLKDSTELSGNHLRSQHGQQDTSLPTLNHSQQNQNRYQLRNSMRSRRQFCIPLALDSATRRIGNYREHATRTTEFVADP